MSKNLDFNTAIIWKLCLIFSYLCFPNYCKKIWANMAHFSTSCYVKVDILQHRLKIPPPLSGGKWLHPFWTFSTTFPWRSSRSYIFPHISNIVLFCGIYPNAGSPMSPMWTARGKIIFVMETTQSDCFQNKMGHLFMKYSGNYNKFPEKVVQCVDLK